MADWMNIPGARIASVLLIICAFACAGARAAPTQPGGATMPAESSISVFLVTMGPGKEVWEKFGHNMLVVVDERAGLGVAYHYGVFNFEQPNFIGRFILGRMLYSMGRDPIGIIDAYVAEDRDVLVQELNLSAAQKQALWDFLEVNYRPANRDYLYDYYRANCSTMLRDALDKPGVLGGALKEHLNAIPTDHTYRWHTRIGMSGDPLIYTGLELALGRPTDVPITAWQEAFIPMQLARRLREIRVKDASGGEVPLVKSEQVRHKSRKFLLPADPPIWWPWFLLIGAAYGSALYLSARKASALRPGPSTAGHWPRRAFNVLAVIWALLSGLAGCFLVFALTTNHAASHWNYNLILFCPIALLLILSPTLFRKRKYLKLVRITSAIVVACAIVVLLLNLVPGRGQMNWDLIALSIPIQVSLAIALWEIPLRRTAT